MTTFGIYSRYYDLLYADKDYRRESLHVLDVLRAHCDAAPATLLDLGCGTGRHAHVLAAEGVAVHGVELSDLMYEAALEARASADTTIREQLQFSRGDATSIRLGRTFDAVTALFHVASYQTQNEQLRSFMITAREHVRPGGVFLFDAWFGPAVLWQRPSVRVKRMSARDTTVTRIATPLLRASENVCEVHYDILVRDIPTGVTHELVEVHAMRYVFVPEISAMLAGVGFELLGAREFLTGRELDFDTWNALFVARRVG